MTEDRPDITEKAAPPSQNFPLEWVSRSREGDALAMEKLFSHFKASFFGLAYRYTYNSTASEDLLQDIFVKIFTHIHELDKDEAFAGWAYRIAVNTCLSYLRRHKTATRKAVPFEVAEVQAGSRDGQAHENLFDRNLEEALKGLSGKLRSVFILHDVQGFKHTEIAQILGCSVGTSKSQLFKARMKIRHCLLDKQIL